MEGVGVSGFTWFPEHGVNTTPADKVAWLAFVKLYLPSPCISVAPDFWASVQAHPDTEQFHIWAIL